MNIKLVGELRHARAIHLAVKGRRQRRLYSSGELGLGPVMKSLINGFLCIQISLQLTYPEAAASAAVHQWEPG